MQATLLPPRVPSRTQSILDLAPRQSSPSAAQFSADAQPGGFASKLADARSARSDADATPTQAVDSTANSPTKSQTDGQADGQADRQSATQTKPATSSQTAKPADQAKSEDEKSDSAGGDDAKVATSATKKVAKKTVDAKPAADAETVDGAVKAGPKVVAEKKPAEPDATATTADAASLVGTPAKPEAKPDKKGDGKKSDVSVAVAAAVVTQGAAKQTDSATADAKDDEQVESATDASADATLLKAAAAASAKGKGKVATTSTEAKAADAKLAAADAAKVPAAHGAATNQEQPEEKSGSKHESSSAATGDSKDAVQSAAAKKSAESTFDAILAKLTPTDADASKPAVTTPAASTPQVTVPAEQKFAADNTDNVVSSVRTQINASGNGQMRIRLDPPELGALDVAVKMVDGRMTASFTTNNDQATQLLSHSLGDLKNSLEANGISVDRIQVRQASAGDNAQQQPGSGEHRRENGNAFDQPSQRGDQQRKEAVQKMWRKLAYGSDELDFVA